MLKTVMGMTTLFAARHCEQRTSLGLNCREGEASRP